MSLLLVPIVSPLIAAILIMLVRRVPSAFALIGAVVALSSSLLLLNNAFNGVTNNLIFSGLPNMPLQLIASPLTTLLSTIVAVVCCFVMVYAVGYMRKDPEKIRFFATLLMFVAAMQTLVLAGDWILLLSAWELIGLCSYLLIGFWYQKPGVKAAAMRAFLVTRSADLGLYIAIFILIASSGSSNIEASLNTTGWPATIAGLLLLIAAMGKSAQTPLHDWLQRAMAGPTPVSALLHSATLVAAGAILLIRTAPMLSPDTLLVIGIVGGITTIVTGLIALGETDLKRMLAASTSSQYGLMLIAVGAGVPMAALLHLVAHAAIKSSLFLAAGVFQHSRETTLLEKLRGVGRDRPRIFFGFGLAALALAGIPPLSGFFSKDAIIAASLNSSNISILLPFALFGTVLTGSYMARVLRILWYGKGTSQSVIGLKWMGAGLAGLVFLTVVLAGVFPTIESLLNIQLPENTRGRFMPEILGLIAAISGLLLGWFVPVQLLLGPLLTWSQHGFAIAGGFNNLVVRPTDAIAQTCEKIEKILYQAVLAIARLIRQNGSEILEQKLYRTVLAIGQFSLWLGHISKRSDEQGIDGFIFGFVRGTVNMGKKARTLQSGLIHKQLAISTVVSTMIIVVMLVVVLLF